MKTSPSACIQLKEGTHVAKCVLMPGDPLRARFIAQNYLEDPVLFNDVRNMLGYTGTFLGKEISVMGSGMGIPSMSIYAQELYRFFDVETIIRVGSAGAIQEDVNLRDVVIPITAATNSACLEAYAKQGIDSVKADPRLLGAAVIAAKEMDIPVNVGSVFTTDYFYDPDEKAIERESARGHLAVEMETAGLYLIAAQNHKRALSILTISDHVLTGEILPSEEIREGFRDMMKIALVTAACMA